MLQPLSGGLGHSALVLAGVPWNVRCFLGSEGILVRRGHPEEAGAESASGEEVGSEGGSQATRAGWNSGLEAGRGQPCCVQGWGNLPMEVRGKGGAKVSLGRRDRELAALRGRLTAGRQVSVQPRAKLLTCALSLCGGLGLSPPILGQSRGTSAPPLSSISCCGERQVPRTWGNRPHGGLGPPYPAAGGLGPVR